MPKLVGILSIIAGLVMVAAGIGTWVMVGSQLADENITVPDDARWFAGEQVRGPLTAFSQADIINQHALAGSDGKTYSELGTLVREAETEEEAAEYQAQRDTMQNASFLRASLFTSVVSFGVAALVIGLGIMFTLLGAALLSLASRLRDVRRDDVRSADVRRDDSGATAVA